MVTLFKNILLTAIALAVLVIFEEWFGMTAAFVAAGVCFLGYVLFVTWRQVRDETDEE